MSTERPTSEQIPVKAIRTALASLKTDLWTMRKAEPEGMYEKSLIDYAERCEREIEDWLEAAR